MESKYKYKGKILVSRPILYDDIFNRTVVLIVEDNEFGTIGFILNRPTENTVDDLVNDFSSESIVYEGGPVHQHKLFFIHKRPKMISESININNVFYWSGDFNDVKQGLQENVISDDEIRFFIGYSGWEEGQLEREIKQNAWLIMDDNFDILAPWDVDLWKRQLKKVGGENLIWINAPKDPLLN